MSKFAVHRGMILRKEAPKGFKRGDGLEIRLGFQPATLEEMQKALGTAEVPEGYIAGWASTAGRDHYNHEVRGGAFQESIDDRGLSGPRGIKLLLDHEWQKPAGVIKVLEYRRDKLWMEAQMNLSVSYVKERWEMLKMMGGANFSVGFMLQDYDVVSREVDGDEDHFLQINRGDLFEISVVMFPANEEAQMTFVKARLHEDNPSEDEVFFAKANTPSWKMGASRNLPLHGTDTEWDGAAAKARIFRAAGFDGENPDYAMVRKAFLAYDSANPGLRGSYKLPFADIVDGQLHAMPSGIRAAASRLPQTDIPDSVKTAARAVIDAYQEREVDEMSSSKNAPTSLGEFEKALVARGLAKSRNEAREIALLAKSCPQVFVKKVEVIHAQQPTLDVSKLTETLLAVKRLNASFAPEAK